MRATVPQPVRTFQDPVTGVTLHQLTDSPEGAAHLYFTRCSWTPDGRYLLLVQKSDGALNYYRAKPGGGLEPLTAYPPQEHSEPTTQHMHRRMPSWEVDRNMIRQPAIHPTEPVLIFALNNRIHRIDIETGADELIYEFGEEDSHQGLTNLQTQITADGRDLVCATCRLGPPGERVDPPEQEWHFSLRDESRFVSKLWRFDLRERRMKGVLHHANGELSHMLACPWDPDLLLWVNYLHKCFYTVRRDGSGLRRYLHEDPRAFPGHYNWDVAHRRLTTLVSDPTRNWRSVAAAFDLETGTVTPFKSTRQWAQCHQNASPDGRWVVLDIKRLRIGGQNGLYMLDTLKDRLYALCQLNCSWKPPRDSEGRAVKSEFLHPNPSFSPDGRYVLVSSDFGTGIPQAYLVDLTTWKPNIRVRGNPMAWDNLARWFLSLLPAPQKTAEPQPESIKPSTP